MKYKVTFINENAKNLKLKATVGTPKQKAYADSLRQMVIDRFKDKVDEELIYHVLNSDWWHKASNVIENRRNFYNNDGLYDEYWMKQFERVKGEVATKNIGKENKSVDLFIPAWAIHWVNDKDWGGYAHILFETRIRSIKVPCRDIVAFPIARVECPKSFIVSNDERGMKITFKKRDGRSLSYFNLKITTYLSDLKNGIENAGSLGGNGAYYATDRKDRGGWGKLVEKIREIDSAFEKSV